MAVTPSSTPLSLYIHIPFCRSKCAYCDFASFPGREADWEAYFLALWTEMDAWRTRCKGRRVETVFFGGGTPSIVPADTIAQTLAHARRAFTIAPDAEISMEANPGTVSRESLRAVRAAGVNRLSLGVQSFDDGILREIGRIHTACEAGEAVRAAREAGFDNLNLDLMYALPGQTTAQWEDTLSRAIALNPEHISAYSLIVEENTPIAARAKEIPDEDTVNRMQRQATKLLAQAGLARYEISNYARPGRECRHNLTYWRRGEYLGLGLAAHSFFAGVRFENPATLGEYLAGAREKNRCVIGPEEALEEEILLATRTTRGLNLAEFAQKFGRDALKARQKTLKALEDGGLVQTKNGFLALTERGMEVQSAVVLALTT